MRENDDGETSTRRCSLPWHRFSVDTQGEPPRAAPCRHFAHAGDARDLDAADSMLGEMRRHLRAGTLDAVCRNCPDQPWMPVAEFDNFLASEGMAGRDSNEMLDAIREVACSALAAPPAELTWRVAHTRSGTDFLISGLITWFDFLPLIRRHHRGADCRLLDWGCGCGRLALPIARRHPEIQLTGCDIDPQAVDWCRSNIRGDFHVIAPSPPTSFEPGRFTTILGFSVVTHLGRELQRAWIRELHALLADDGIVIVTTMGMIAARLHGLADQLLTEGIIDDRLDDTLDAVAPPGYYRSTFQSREFTEQVWGDDFDLIEYIEAGAFHYQDIAVFRKKPKQECADAG